MRCETAAGSSGEVRRRMERKTSSCQSRPPRPVRPAGPEPGRARRARLRPAGAGRHRLVDDHVLQEPVRDPAGRCAGALLVAQRLAQEGDLADEVGLGIGVHLVHREPRDPSTRRAYAPVLEPDGLADLGERPDAGEPRGRLADLPSLPDEDHPERRPLLQAALGHPAVPGLEDVERDHEPRRQDRVEREERDSHASGRRGRVPARSHRYSALPQNLHFVAASATDSLQYGHSFVGPAGASLMNVRAMRKTTKATITKTMTMLMKLPYRMATSWAGSAVPSGRS